MLLFFNNSVVIVIQTYNLYFNFQTISNKINQKNINYLFNGQKKGKTIGSALSKQQLYESLNLYYQCKTTQFFHLLSLYFQPLPSHRLSLLMQTRDCAGQKDNILGIIVSNILWNTCGCIL